MISVKTNVTQPPTSLQQKRDVAAPATPAAAKPAPIDRSSAGIREMLFAELDAIRSGNSSTGRANAVAKLATAITESVRLEMEFAIHRARLLEKNPGAVAMLDPIRPEKAAGG